MVSSSSCSDSSSSSSSKEEETTEEDPGGHYYNNTKYHDYDYDNDDLFFFASETKNSSSSGKRHQEIRKDDDTRGGRRCLQQVGCSHLSSGATTTMLFLIIILLVHLVSIIIVKQQDVLPFPIYHLKTTINATQQDNTLLLEGDDEDEDDGLDIKVEVIGDPIPVWKSIDSLHRCHHIDVPDIPTRAYMDSSSTIHMIQGSTNFHEMIGHSLFDTHRICNATWNTTGNGDPSYFAANEFLDSPYVFDNGTVVSLVHTEYPGNRYNNCPGPIYPYCWTVTMGLMVSYDYGTTWQHIRPPPDHLVAAVPYKYKPTDQLAFGWGDPTNILKHPHEAYYYVAAWNRNSVGLQKAGICIMRTQHLLDPSSWRGWNHTSQAYDVKFVSPYNHSTSAKDDKNFDPSNHICSVLDVDDTSNILDPTKCNPFGLVYSKPLELFLMTWNCMNTNDIYITSSKNLIDWSKPQSFYNRTMLPPDVRHNVTSMNYPNLMDPIAPQRYGDNNYGIISSEPYLFWVSFGHNVYVDGRTAWATPLRITNHKNNSTTKLIESKTKKNQHEQKKMK